MMKRTNKKRNILSVCLLGFLISSILILLVSVVFGVLVLKTDLRGPALFILQQLILLPACVFYPVFVQRRLHYRGVVCGLIFGGAVSIVYIAALLIINSFHLQPITYLVFPISILVSCICGIVSSNIRRH